MAKNAKRVLSWVLAVTLLTTCTISGLVLPATAADENLLVNGDFEQGTTGWENNGYIVAGGGKDGSTGIKIETTVSEGESAKQPGVYYKTAFNSALKPNTTYILSFDYKHEGKGWPQFNVVKGGTDWTGWTNVSLSSNVDWTTKTIEFTTGAAENMNANTGWEWKARVVHYANAANYGSAVTQFDNFKLIEKPAVATGITLSETTATIKAGATKTLTVTATPAGASLPTVIWTTSDANVATVADGVVTAVAAGTATITAAAGELTATCTVTVEANSNLFLNGDFEGFAESTPVVSPWSYVAEGGTQTGVGMVTAGVGVGGSYGLKLGASTGSMYVAFPNKVNLEEGATYRLSWQAKSGTTSKAAAVTLNSAPNTTLVHGTAKKTETKLATAAGEWISYYIDFTAGAGAYIHDVGGIVIERLAADSAEIVFDNFAIEKIGEDVDLILDGDFENGSDASLYAFTLGGSYTLLSNENKAAIVTVPTAENANNRAMELKTSASGWTGGYFNGSHFVGGESYKVTMDYKGGSFRFYANPASHGSFNDNKASVISYAASEDWKTIEFTFNFLTAGSNNWAFSFEKNNGNNSAATYIDNFKIVKIVDEPVQATGITLDKTAETLEVGKTVTLTPSATPAGAALPTITWTTSDANVATVADGVVTAVAAGTATITATAGELTATCTVTVKAPVSDGNLLVNGDFEQGASVSWGGSAYVVDGVGVDGSKGYKIESTVNEGDSAKTLGAYYKEAFNSLLKPNTTYVVSFDYKTEGKGFARFQVIGGTYGSDWTGWTAQTNLTSTEWKTHTFEFTTGATENMKSNTGWEWKLERIHYANASSYGTGAVYYDNIKVVEKVVVAPTDITLNLDQAKLEVGSDVQLSVTAAPENAEKPEITWTTSDANVATVVGGKVTAVGVGTATITATAGALTDTCTVTVIADDGNLLENGDLELGAAVAWGNSKYVLNGVGKDGGWGIKINTEVAEGGASVWPGAYYKGAFNTLLKPNTKYIFSFDYKNEGKGFSRINVLKKGSDWTNWATVTNLSATEWTTVTIEFTTGAEANMVSDTGWEWIPEHVQYASAPGTGAGYFDNFKLVEKVVVPATAIKLDKATANLKPGQTTTLTATSEPADAEPPVITWTTSDANVATVVDGVVTAVAEGTATITATYGALTATCTITVKPDDGNIIINGDFSSGTDAWGRDQGQKDKIVADGGKDGAGIKLSTKVDATTTTHQTPGVYYLDKIIAALEPDSIYTFSFDYKHEGMGFGQVVFNIAPGKLENGTELKNVALASGDKDWTTMSYTITTGSTLPTANTGWEWQMRQVQYYDKGEGEGTSYFDNFKLVKVGTVVHADAIGLSTDVLEILPYDSSSLAVTTSPVGASTGVLTWVSSDPSIIEVDSKGNIKALKNEGEVTITVTNDKGKTASAKVVISENANVFKNGDFELGGVNWDSAAIIKPGIGKDGGYGVEVRNEKGSGWASYYYKGSLVDLMQPATTYIFSIDYYAPSVTSEVRLWSYDLGFSASVGNFKVGKDEWQTYTKIFTTPTDMELRTGWDFSMVCETTGDPAVVFDNISIKKYSSGIDADSIVLNLNKMTLIPGRTGALTAHATPVEADLNDMTWTSSDENVATVEYGVVTGVGKGTAVITGTTKNGKSATCTVTVSGNDVLVLNGSFDTTDDAWTLADGAEIADGEGRVNSKAGKLVKDATIKQVFKGLEAETPYQLFIRYRTVSGKAAIKLENGSEVLVNEETGTNSLWTTLTYEFTTGATVEEDTVLTLTGLGNGPIYVDNIVLAVKASLIDFTVADVIWVGGGHQVKPGTELTFAVTVTNIGVDPVLAEQVIVVDLCKNGEVFQTLEYTCDTTVGTGDSVIVMATAPWAAVKGDWVISARANPTLSILELDDSNNTKQVNLRVNETILEAPKEAADMEMTELIFSDEFDSYDSIDMYATGKDGYKWYVTRSWGAGTVQPNSYTVKDGIISLHDQKPVFNITLSTVDAVTGVGWDYHYGYLETRLRIVYPNRHEYAEGMSGGIPAIWSFPTDKWLERPGKNRHWVEMDWLEYWGRDTQRWPQYPDGYYTVTLHDQVQNDAGQQESWKVNSNSYQNGLGDGEWHVMGWLWAYNGVVAYIDGEEVFRITYSADGVPSCRVRTNAGDMFNDIGAFSYMNEQDLCLYIAGAYDKPLELDYVRIWQGGNAEVEAPEEDTEEDGETEIVLDIPAEEFYHNYCTDDWGDPIVKVNEENYLNVIAGGEFWGYLTADRQAEINAMLAANGQPKFEDLLAAANAVANPSPDTGATTALPIAVAALMPACAAAAWLTRKRRRGDK